MGVVRSAPLVTPDKVIVVAGQDECLYGVGPVGTLAWKTQMPGQILAHRSPIATVISTWASARPRAAGTAGRFGLHRRQ